METEAEASSRDAATSSKHLKPPDVKEAGRSLPESPEGVPPCDTLVSDFWPPDGESISVALNHPVCGNSLQPQETNPGV